MCTCAPARADPGAPRTQTPQSPPNFKTGEKEWDPRATWKEAGESLAADANKGSPEKRVRVPDAITQTDNSAKRAQNAQMRSRKVAADEPEALRKMREEREAREAQAAQAAQDAADTAAAADAKRRAETGNFISGQDLREARMVDEYKRQKAAAGAAGAEATGEGGTDIRQKVRAMQGSAKRMRADKERLQHQSMRSGKSLAEVADAVVALLNAQLPEALGDMVLTSCESISAAAAKANAWMNGSFRVPRAQVLALSEDGLKVRAEIVKTGFFGNEQTSSEDVMLPWPEGAKVKSDDDLRYASV